MRIKRGDIGAELRVFLLQVTGLKDVLVDYYVTATDKLGNTKKTDIYHVYVGPGVTSCPPN